MNVNSAVIVAAESRQVVRDAKEELDRSIWWSRRRQVLHLKTTVMQSGFRVEPDKQLKDDLRQYALDVYIKHFQRAHWGFVAEMDEKANRTAILFTLPSR